MEHETWQCDSVCMGQSLGCLSRGNRKVHSVHLVQKIHPCRRHCSQLWSEGGLCSERGSPLCQRELCLLSWKDAGARPPKRRSLSLGKHLLGWTWMPASGIFCWPAVSICPVCSDRPRALERGRCREKHAVLWGGRAGLLGLNCFLITRLF